MTQCKICNNDQGNKSHHAREMMFGYRDEFKYIECKNCGCIFLKEIPASLGKYYPPNYYSMARKRMDPFIVWAGALILKQYLRSSITGKILARRIDLSSFDWMREVKLEAGSSILDVGCGIGKLLLVMREMGYKNLTGIDPFIPQDLFYKNDIKILKKELRDLVGEFDFIMLHHSFEHMFEPLSVLNELHRLTKPGGMVLIRIPVAQTYAWQKYGIHWFQLDAPRHVFLHSVKSFRLLVEKAGMVLKQIVFDSTELQFWGSEQYKNDIPLLDGRSYQSNRKKSMFSSRQIIDFRRQAQAMNYPAASYGVSGA